MLTTWVYSDSSVYRCIVLICPHLVAECSWSFQGCSGLSCIVQTPEHADELLLASVQMSAETIVCCTYFSCPLTAASGMLSNGLAQLRWV